MQECIEKRHGVWPGSVHFGPAEQAYWNLSTLSPTSIKGLFALPNTFSWQDFLTFCEPYCVVYVGNNASCKLAAMAPLLPIYQAFPTPEDRTAFLAFCEPHLVWQEACMKPHFLADLFPIYQILQAYPTPELRADFRAFCYPHFPSSPATVQLLRIYQAYPTAEHRAGFMAFGEHYLVGMVEPFNMVHFLPIFQAFSGNAELGRHFTDFMKLHNKTDNPRITTSIITSFLPRTYLRYMRAAAAFQAETPNAVRIQALYETDQFNQLPVLWGADPLLAQARGNAGVAGAHDFETIYGQDYSALVLSKVMWTL